MTAIALGTLLAAVAWLPAACWFLVRRASVPDRWFLGALAWGVAVVAVVVVLSADGDAWPRDGAETWLLLETAVLWMAVTLVRTRRRTPR